VHATNSSTQCLEIEHIGVWAAQNNLTLNCGKTKEMVIRAGGKRGKLVNPPAPYALTLSGSTVSAFLASPSMNSCLLLITSEAY